MGGPRRPVEVREMKKPKFKIGERVTVDFIGGKHEVTLTELKKNPQHIDRWIYKGVSDSGLTIPYIGVDGSEKFANIYTVDKKKLKKDLDVPNE